MSQNTEFRRKLGNLGIHKGRLDDVPITMWDAIPQCDPATCNLADTCPYQKVGRCTLRVKYLANVFEAVSSVPENMDTMTILKIGMHIIPMYSQLCRFKMEEHHCPTMIADSKGNLKVNPIFREIRETIKCCASLVSELDGTGGGGIPADGDADYYDNLFNDSKVLPSENETTMNRRSKLRKRK
jgi:hypothetical protein